MKPGNTAQEQFSARLGTGGFRLTPQRQHVYRVLLQKRDHPTAEEVFMRSKRDMPDISLATVYNCLDALVRCGLARQVSLDRGAARFCPNMSEHGHFYCDICESIYDIEMPDSMKLPLPEGFEANRCSVSVHGRCRSCNELESSAIGGDNVRF